MLTHSIGRDSRFSAMVNSGAKGEDSNGSSWSDRIRNPITYVSWPIYALYSAGDGGRPRSEHLDICTEMRRPLSQRVSRGRVEAASRNVQERRQIYLYTYP